FNADGCEDLMAQSNAFSIVLPGAPGGGFGPQLSSFNPQAERWPLAAGDFDGDGLPDVAAYYKNGSLLYRLELLHGLGDGQLVATVPTFLGPSFTNLPGAAADVDLDGDLDLAACSGTNIATGLNSGSGKFTETYTPVLAALRDVELGDVDGDGLPDTVAAADGISGVRVFHNLGGGALASAHQAGTAANVTSVELGDIDGDG